MIFSIIKKLFLKSAKSKNLRNPGSDSKRIYLDHASATQTEDFVLDKYVEVSKKYFGNTSSIHVEGEKSKEIFNEARRRVAKCIKARAHNLYFAGSTTEANNIFIKGVVLASPPFKGGVNFSEGKIRGGNIEIIYSSSDHSAIIEPILWCKKFLEREDFKINLIDIKPNKIGKILVEDVVKNLTINTKLICLSQVNSETGTIQDVKRLSQEVKKFYEKLTPPSLPFARGGTVPPKIFVDASQAIKFFEIDVHNLGVDGISFGFSKIGGLAGSACLWVKDQTKLESIISGGGQEEGIRSGTENIPAIVANSYLLEKICDRKMQQEKKEYVYDLRNYLINQVESLNELFPSPIGGGSGRGPALIFGDTHFKYNKFFEDAVPHILLLSVKDMLGEELCLRLDARNISVSTATACSLLENSGSNFLKSIKEPVLAKETIRISMSEKNTKKEIDKFVEALKDIIQKFCK